MPTTRLPDVNTQFITARTKLDNAIADANYDGIINNVLRLNSLLPRTLDDKDQTKYKYRIIISTEKYYDAVKSTVLYECYNCHKESKLQKLRIFKTKNTGIYSILSKKTESEWWICPECKKFCKLSQTEPIVEKYDAPHYFGVVPDPPKKIDTLLDAGEQFNRKIKKWGLLALTEIEERSAEYRDNNWKRGDDYATDTDQIEGGEIA